MENPGNLNWNWKKSSGISIEFTESKSANHQKWPRKSLYLSGVKEKLLRKAINFKCCLAYLCLSLFCFIFSLHFTFFYVSISILKYSLLFALSKDSKISIQITFFINLYEFFQINYSNEHKAPMIFTLTLVT